MTTPSEGEAMLALADQVSEKSTWRNGNKQGLSDWFSLDEINLIIKALRAAAQSSGVRETYTEYCMNEKCPRGVGVPIEVVRLSPDTPREVVVPHEDCLNCRCLPHEMCEGRRVISPVKTEQLDQAQFGRVLHKRPDTPREGER